MDEETYLKLFSLVSQCEGLNWAYFTCSFPRTQLDGIIGICTDFPAKSYRDETIRGISLLYCYRFYLENTNSVSDVAADGRVAAHL